MKDRRMELTMNQHYVISTNSGLVMVLRPEYRMIEPFIPLGGKTKHQKYGNPFLGESVTNSKAFKRN